MVLQSENEAFGLQDRIPALSYIVRVQNLRVSEYIPSGHAQSKSKGIAELLLVQDGGRIVENAAPFDLIGRAPVLYTTPFKLFHNLPTQPQLRLRRGPVRGSHGASAWAERKPNLNISHFIP